MEEQLISFKTAKLAKEKGFDSTWSNAGYHPYEQTLFSEHSYRLLANDKKSIAAPPQSILQKFIREERGVHINVNRNASGYYWEMCRSEGGTDLGWSEFEGPNLSGDWDTFEQVLEDAMYTQLSYDLPENTAVIKHWGNYARFAITKK